MGEQSHSDRPRRAPAGEFVYSPLFTEGGITHHVVRKSGEYQGYYRKTICGRLISAAGGQYLAHDDGVADCPSCSAVITAQCEQQEAEERYTVGPE